MAGAPGAATILPAKAYGLTKEPGARFEPGHLADLIIVSGDPLKNIDDAANVQCVMAENGQLQSVATIMSSLCMRSANQGRDLPEHLSSQQIEALWQA